MSRYDSIASRNIRQAIDAKETNPNAISRKTGISYSTFNRKLESGSFTVDQLEKIALALDTNAPALLVDVT